jgi:putative ABC transport system permease protein
VAASASVLEATGAGVGDELVVDGEPRTVVGLVRDPERLSSRLLLAPPTGDDGTATRWLVDLPDPAAAEVVAEALRSDDAYGVQTRADGARRSTGESAALVLLGGLGRVEAALIASAAFAVSTRRRQRALGLLAATGGDPGQLRRVVLLSGVLLGALGAVAGVVGVRLVEGQLQSWSDRALDGIVVDPVASLAMVVLGVASAAAAAWVPARAASRLPLLLAVATGLVVLAIALTLAAAETRSDQRSLLAVGADPALRRSIAAGRAAVLGGLGGVLAVPAGLLPVFGLLCSASDIELVVPWGSLALVGLGTPLLAVAGAWVLTRPSPAWTAYRAAG